MSAVSLRYVYAVRWASGTQYYGTMREAVWDRNDSCQRPAIDKVRLPPLKGMARVVALLNRVEEHAKRVVEEGS